VPSSQALVIFWSPGKVNVSVQLLSADVPVLLIVTFAWNPPAHWLAVVYVTEHALAAAEAELSSAGVSVVAAARPIEPETATQIRLRARTARGPGRVSLCISTDSP
jgi:hypothetical protein